MLLSPFIDEFIIECRVEPGTTWSCRRQNGLRRSKVAPSLAARCSPSISREIVVMRVSSLELF
jgi:hypothetical protein